MLIGAIVYGAKFAEASSLSSSSEHLHAGFALAIIAGVFSIVAGVFISTNQYIDFTCEIFYKWALFSYDVEYHYFIFYRHLQI